MRVDRFTRLTEAREWLADQIRGSGGAICPCCRKLDKVYIRNISQPTVHRLWDLYKYSQTHVGDYFAIGDFVTDQNHGRDFPILRFISLLERAPNDDPSKGTAGEYRIMEDGIEFCEGRMEIPKHLVLYHNELVSMSDQFKGIEDYWPNFNYEELMAS